MIQQIESKYEIFMYDNLKSPNYENKILSVVLQAYNNNMVLVRERTITTERPPLVGEVSATFCG
jgi:hypothetical protein